MHLKHKTQTSNSIDGGGSIIHHIYSAASIQQLLLSIKLSVVLFLSIIILSCSKHAIINPETFRSEFDTLSVQEVKRMVVDKQFFDKYWKQDGGFRNIYKLVSIDRFDVVRDDATQLMWYRSGSKDFLTLPEARTWIAELNYIKYAGYSDWRLPTLEEALSLMENVKMNGSLYIDPKFDSWQWCILTGDLLDESHSWLVAFSGRVDWSSSNVSINYVRPVRSFQNNGFK